MFHIFRSLLWTLLFMCSAVLLGLTAYRIHQTETRNDFFRPGLRFYDPIIVELLVTSALTLLFTMWFLHAILRRFARGPFATYLAELLTLFILWVMFLIGAAVVTHRYRFLGRCRSQSKTCRILETIKAFSWICWGLITLLMFASLGNMVSRKHDVTGPVHGRADTTGTGAQTRQVGTTGTTGTGNVGTTGHTGHTDHTATTGTTSTTGTAHENPVRAAEGPATTGTTGTSV